MGVSVSCYIEIESGTSIRYSSAKCDTTCGW